MNPSANVTAIETVQDFRNALARFCEEGAEALASAEMEIRRTFDWLQDQITYWQRMIRQCEEELVEARAALFRKEMPNALGRIPDCIEEKKAVSKAKARLEHAHEKVKVCRHWQTKWQQAVNDYEGPAKRLAGLLDGSLRSGIHLLDTKVAALEAYVRLAHPAPPGGPGSA